MKHPLRYPSVSLPPHGFPASVATCSPDRTALFGLILRSLLRHVTNVEERVHLLEQNLSTVTRENDLLKEQLASRPEAKPTMNPNAPSSRKPKASLKPGPISPSRN